MRRLHLVGTSALFLLALSAVACIDTAAPTLDAPHEVIAAITIQPSEAKAQVGKRIPFDALAFDPAGHELEARGIIWKSTDTSIATVSDEGEVTAKRVGSTLITATDGSKTGMATLTVLAPEVASVVLSPASADLLAGDTVRFSAQARDDEAQTIGGRTVKWSVANPAIATIAGGVLVGLSAGTTIVKATVDGISDSAVVQVSARPVASVSVVPGTLTLTSGKSSKLGTTVLDDRGKAVADKIVTWSSDDEKVATVSSDGTVSAVSSGTATITATVTRKGSNGKAKTGKGQVKVTTTTAPVASVAVTPATGTLVTSSTLQLTAIPKDADGAALGGRTVSWKSSDSDIATVSSSGLVTGVAAGKVTITAASEEKSGSSTITVTLPLVTSLTVSPSSAEILVGKSTSLTATTRDADGKTLTGRSITWSSGRSSVATVASNGMVSGVAAGSAWIFATSEGVRDSAAIVVTRPPVATVSVSPSSASLEVGGTKSLTVTLMDASGSTLTGRTVTWVSSDQSVATVTSAGVVTAVAAGSATITAASEGKTGTSRISVAAPEPPNSEPPTSSDPPPSDGSTGGSHSGVFVSPSGSSGASGKESSPMSLSAALSGGNGKIQPGDTVWLRQGTYRGNFSSTLAGSANAPIIFRQYPGERATIDGTLSVNGRHLWFWGFEVANTSTSSSDVTGINSRCTGCRFINLVIHDHSGSGLGMWSEGPDQEAYANLVYNNGFHGQSIDHAGHGIYAQNQSGTKRLINNIIFDQFGYGMHVYGSKNAYLDNFTIQGNTAFNNSIGTQTGMSGGMDYQVGGSAPLKNLVFTQNNSYRSPSVRDANTARIGYNWGPMNTGGVITNNYFVGHWILVNWSSFTNSGNTILDGSMPSQTRVVVQPNKYEAGRANVIVYNWGRQGAISVDLSKVLRSGQRYEIRNVQNFYGTPVTSGTYGGGSVSIPMASVTPAPTISSRGKGVSTGTEFNAYVVVAR